MLLVDRHLGVALTHGVGSAVPPRHADRDAVRLGRHGQVPARPAPGQFEGVLQHPVGTEARVDRLLDHDLAIGAGVHDAAQIGVFALGVLAHDEEIDLAGPARPPLRIDQRAGHAFEQPHRAQVDVLVELAPKLEQRAPQRHVVGHPCRPADRTEKNRVHALQLTFPVVRHHLAGVGVVVATGPADRRQIQHHAEALLRRLQHPQSLRHDFLADAVAGDHRDLARLCHGLASSGDSGSRW